MAENIVSIKPIDTAAAFDASFCRFEGIQGLEYIQKTKAGLIFIPESLYEKIGETKSILIPCELWTMCMLRKRRMSLFSTVYSKSDSNGRHRR